MKNEDLYVYKKSDFYEDFISSQKEYYEREQVDTLIAEKDREIAELKAKVKFCSDFELAARKDIEEMRGQHQMLKQFGHYKLSPVPGKMINHEVRQYVSYNVVCMIIKHLESENKELKQKLEDVQASMYADVVDANMENRRLKRALYNLRVCYADMMQKRYIECKTDGWVHRIDKWIEVERRCLKKAEEYK